MSLDAVAPPVAELSALVARHPLDERFRRLFMIALYKSDRRADALMTYHEACAALRENLGIDAGEALRSTYNSILTLP